MGLTTIFANLPAGNAPASYLDTNFNEVGAMGVTACTASGTNAISLTPLSNQTAVNSYGNYQIFSFVAAGSSTSGISVNVNGVGTLGLYWPDGTQAGAQGLIAGVYYQIAYNSALNSGAGGFAVVGIGTQGQIRGTNTNDNAGAGMVGEYGSNTVNSASAVGLVTGTSKNITSINLTAGDWDIGGKVSILAGTSTAATLISGDIGLSSAASFSADTSIAFSGITNLTNGAATSLAINTRRASVASTTTYYLNAFMNFTGGTAAAYGIIWARRAR
jgi:hypothetical protein